MESYRFPGCIIINPLSTLNIGIMNYSKAMSSPSLAFFGVPVEPVDGPFFKSFADDELAVRLGVFCWDDPTPDVLAAP